MRGAVDEDELCRVSSLGRLAAGAVGVEAAFLAATWASNSAADKRSRPGIWDDGGMELGGDEGGGDGAAAVMTSSC